MPNLNKILFPLVVFLFFYDCQAPQGDSSNSVNIELAAEAFELSQVRLLPGPFLKATNLNVKSLLQYEPDRFLAKFRTEAGLEPRAEHYRGWESETISGHSLGHYLSGCALMFQTTGDDQFKERVNYIVDELAESQAAHGDGYIGAIPKGKQILADEIGKGDISAQPFFINGLWAPFYNLHKLMAGLRDAYHLCENEQALQVEKGLADWIGRMVGGMTPEQIQKMLSCEHGGINEVLVDLYADTGDEKYLELSRVFYHKKVLDPLADQRDILPGIHGNTQIPKLIGLARRYELTGDEKDLRAASFFWDRVVNYHSYVTGGHGNHEYFGPADQLRNRLSDETTESCNVYNMLRLSRHLFQIEARAEIADFYERALFNHILSSQNPNDGRVIYNLSLEMGGKKTYQNPFGFTCCVGSGMENHSKYGLNIFFRQEETLFVNQFIAAELDWEEKGLKIRQTTNYPVEQGTSLQFSCEQPVDLALQIRYPAWLTADSLRLLINGKPQKVDQAPGSFIRLDRKWQDGDEVKMFMPFQLRLEAMPDDESRVAVLYGPLVLAGDLGPEDVPNPYARDFVPIFRTADRNPGNWLKPVAGKANTFRSQGVGVPRDVTFQPFYTIHHRRYSVYWDLGSEEEWQAREAAYQAELEKKKQLAAASYDSLIFGDETAEAQHQVRGDKSHISSHRGRNFRVAERTGWFGWQMKVDPDRAMTLVADYWGGFTGSKTFDIVVDGEKIATENVAQKADGQYVIVHYPIPESLTAGKKQVEIKFMPHVGHRAGPVFEVWML